MENLLLGTIIDFDIFSAVVVAENLMLVFYSQTNCYVREGQLVKLIERGKNDWVVSIIDNNAWPWQEQIDYIISCDWNDKIYHRSFDHNDYGDDDFWWDYDPKEDEYESIYNENDW